MGTLPYAKQFQDLVVYRKARAMAREVFSLSQNFPRAETYSLTDQIRRASGSVGAQIAEAWGKRRYAKQFVNKLTDADSEQLETQHWIALSFDRSYLTSEDAVQLTDSCAEIGRMLGEMIQRADAFCKASTPKQSESKSPLTNQQSPTTDH